MKTRGESFLITQVTKSVTALIVQSNNKIKDKFSIYLNNVFKEVEYIDNYEKVLEHVKNKKPNLIFLDILTKELQPFQLIDDIRYIEPRQVIIAMSELNSVDILEKCIFHRVNHFISEPIETIKLKDSITHCLDCVLLNSPDKLYNEISNNTDNDPFSALKYLMESFHTQVELINNYKGVPIAKEAKILDIIKGEVTLRIPELQKYIINDSKHTIISSKYLYDDIYAYVKEVDYDKNIAVFNKLSYINSYIHHRKQIRLEPDKDFISLIEIGNKKIECKTINISSNYLLISLKNIPQNLKVNSQIKCYLSLKDPHLKQQSRFSLKSIQAPAIVEDIFLVKNNYKVLLYLELNNEKSKIIDDYIYRRSLELIKEFKKRYTS